MADSTSFTAASTIPAKLFCDDTILESARRHRIRPIHVQISPTNKCTRSCSFCSCKNRDKFQELSVRDTMDIVDILVRLGTRAVTVTGGGEPLAHWTPDRLLNVFMSRGLQVGLTTNGDRWDRLRRDTVGQLTWCRVSLSDEQKIPPQFGAYRFPSNVDFSFSYVVTKNFNPSRLREAVQFANVNRFSHVRVVNDIIDEGSPEMGTIREALKGIDDSLVVYQGRKQHSKGHSRCLFSLLKPYIDASGLVMPCCGVQYATEPPKLDNAPELAMCQVYALERAVQEQVHFCGNVCKRCYYADYNDILNKAWDADRLKHKAFV